MASESNCLTQDLLIGLLQDSLSKEEQLRAAEHVQTCQICQKELETICEQRKIELPETTSVESDNAQGSVAEWSGKLAQQLMAELQQDGRPDSTSVSDDAPSMATIISTEENPSETEQTVERGAVDSETSVTKQQNSRSDSPTELHISEMFGRYKVEKILGQGAMGAVYLARDTQLDRDVALKIPKFGSGNNVDDQELLERFYREARAAATLRSPHICPVYDVGEIDGQHYITMAYIEGRPLKDFTKSKKKHSEKQIVTTVRKLAQGLAEAHEIGVVHRDLKPANVMVDKKGEPVVMDFGLARRSSSDDVQVTQSGAIMGTPAYMSPEQVEGDQDKIGPQADIYALGIIMYELITGEMPYKGSLMSILQQIALNNPEKPSKLRSDLDPRLEQICLKMMAGDLTKRYYAMEEVAADLQEVMRTPRKKSKQQTSANPSPKQTSIPTATEESNPALISIAPQSITEQLREKRGAASKSKRKTSSGSSSSGGNKNLLIAGGVIGLLLLMGIVFLVRVGKYDVQITLEDPGITLSVDDNKLNINDGQNVIQLSAGPHKLQLEKDGLKTQVEEFTVTKDGKTALTATIVNGKLDALLGGESIPSKNGRSVVKNSPSGSKQKTVAKPADYDKLATGTWKSLSGNKEIIVDKNNPGSQFNAGFQWFPETVERDVLARAKVKMIDAVSVGIHVRTTPNPSREFSYVGEYNHQTSMCGIFVVNSDYRELKNKQIFNAAVYDHKFFEIAVAAVGSRLSVYIDGQQVIETTDNAFSEGYIGLFAFEGSAIFKDVEVMSLDDISRASFSGDPDGFALRFNEDWTPSNSDHVIVPTLRLPQGKSYTMEMWTQTTPVREARNKRHPNLLLLGSDGRFGNMITTSGYGEFELRYTGAKNITAADRSVAINQPAHLAAVFDYDKQEARLFVNGHLAASGEMKEEQNGGEFSICKQVYGADKIYYKGWIDEVRLSDTARYHEDFTPQRRFEPDNQTLALYHFDEGSGDVLKDSSGNGHHGKIIGAKWVGNRDIPASAPADVPSRAGEPGYALSFPGGEENFVDVQTLVGKDFDDGPCTIETWYRVDRTLSGDPDVALTQYVVGLWQERTLLIGDFNGAYGKHSAFGKWHGTIWEDSTKARSDPSAWTHAALVRDENRECRLYVNGRFIAKDKVQQCPAPFRIGIRYAGEIDETRVSNVVRYTEDFTPANRFEPDEHTLALYHFDEGTGDILKDSSGNGHDGKIIGAKWVKVGGDGTSEPQVVETSTYPGQFAVSFPEREESYVEVATLDSKLMDGLLRDKKMDLTIEFWLNRDQNKISPHDHYAGWSDSYLFVRSAAGSEYVEGGEWGGRGAPPVVFYDTVAPTRTLKNEAVWTHIAAVLINPTEYRLFVDGKLVDTKPAEWGWPGSVDPFQLMAQAAGMMGETRISTTARYDKNFTPEFGFKPDEHTLALYHFDEGAGDILKDSSGNGHHGKIVGAQWARLDRSTTNQVTSTSVPDASVGNFALRFNEDWKPNNSDHVLVPTLKYPVGKSYTLEMWTQRDPLPDPNPIPDGDRFPPFAIEAHLKLLGFGDQGLNSLGTDAASLFAVRIREGGISATDQNIGRRQQQHLAAVFDLEHDEVRFFINGDLAGRSQFPKDSLRGPFSICHQEYQAERRRYAGWIDEVRVSSSARYSENFKPAQRFEPDEHTLALYHFDEGTGDVLKDSSGNGHHGKIVGAKWVRVDNRATNLSDQPPVGRTITSDDGSVELLPLIQYPDDAGPSADGDPGKLEIQDDGVLFSRFALARVPVVVDSDKYEIEWEFTLKNDFQLLLPVGEMLQMLDIQRDHSLFHIKGVPPTEHANIAGKRTKIRVLVDLSQAPAQFTVDLNGQKIIEFEAAVTSLKDIRDSWVKDRWNIDKLMAAGSLAIIPNGATIHSFKIKLHEGEAKLLRSGDSESVMPGAGSGLSSGENVPPTAVAPFDEAQAKAHQKAWADYLGEPVVTTNQIGTKLALIPPGTFKMGEGENAVDVTSTQPFRLGVHEVTQREWTAVMETEPWKGQKETQVGDDVAATFVSWPDAAEYCRKLTQREQTAGTLRDGWEYRLPTQAEWEFALRSGTTGEWAFADGKNIGDYGWIDENAKNVGQAHAHVVGQKKPSPWGLYDLHGNVWEWCSDWNSNDLQGGVDPQGPTQGSARAYRGGSWHDGAWYSRAPVRHAAHETARDPYRGFRLALAPAAGTPITKVESSVPMKLSEDAPPPAVAPFDEAQAKAHQKVWADYLDVPVEYENNLSMKFRLIPPGEFMMGCPEDEIEWAMSQDSMADSNESKIRSAWPQHQVVLTRPYYMSTTEVTQSIYKQVMGKNPSQYSEGNTESEDGKKVVGIDTSQFPAESMTWLDAAEFCAKLSEMEQLKPQYFRGGLITLLEGNGYRLPTEAEWEFACRAGTTTMNWVGEEQEALRASDWTGLNSGGRTHNVGQLKPNPFGLFDMLGNVWEWTGDHYEEGYFETLSGQLTVDPEGPTNDDHLRIIKGGQIHDYANARSGARSIYSRAFSREHLGFRLVLPVEAVKELLAE